MIRRRRDPMPDEFKELAAYNGRVGEGAVFPPEYVAAMAELQKQFDAWNEWQLRREGFRPAGEISGLEALVGLWIQGPA